MTTTQTNLKSIIAATSLAVALARTATAGTFSTITIDGDFSDWATVPVLTTDPNDGFAKDLNQVQLANDSTNFYIRITYYLAANPNTGSGFFLAFDNDNTVSTGFNIYSLGVVGSEVAYQNDFPFQQSAGTFNTNATTAAPITISPYNSTTLSQEFSIPRNAVINTTSGALIFPNESFTFGAYFDTLGEEDFTGAVPYTFAVPEASTAALLTLGLLSTTRRRRTPGPRL